MGGSIWVHVYLIRDRIGGRIVDFSLKTIGIKIASEYNG